MNKKYLSIFIICILIVSIFTGFSINKTLLTESKKFVQISTTYSNETSPQSYYYGDNFTAAITEKNSSDYSESTGILTLYDKKDNILWEFTSETAQVSQCYKISGPYVYDESQDKIIFICGNLLYCLDILSGNLLFTYKLDGDGVNAVFIDEDTLAVISYLGTTLSIIDFNDNGVVNYKACDSKNFAWPYVINKYENYIEVTCELVEDLTSASEYAIMHHNELGNNFGMGEYTLRFDLNGNIIPVNSYSNSDMYTYYYSMFKEIEDIEASLDLNNLATTADMNSSLGYLYTLWDDALNDIYQYIVPSLSDDEYQKLLSEELEWIQYKESTSSIAASEFEGGTLEPIQYTITSIELTKDRCYELLASYIN